MENIIDSELSDRLSDIESHTEKLILIQNDLKAQLHSVSQELDTSFGPSESFVSVARSKYTKTCEILEKESCPDLALDLEITRREFIQSLKDDLEHERQRIRSELDQDLSSQTERGDDPLDRFLTRKIDHLLE